VNEQNQVPR